MVGELGSLSLEDLQTELGLEVEDKQFVVTPDSSIGAPQNVAQEGIEDLEGENVEEAMDHISYETYGVLYNWPAAMDACPDGWHLPSQDEWNILADTLGGTSVAGGSLKEAGLDHWVTPNAGATNESGFTALPAGYRHSSGSFGFKGTHGDFWTSTEVNDVSARWKGMLYDQQNLSKGSISKQNGFSVRCVKDAPL